MALLNEILSKTKYLNSRNYDFSYPVFLIWGENDKLIPNRIGAELNEYFKSSELQIIPKACHLVTIEQKVKFSTILNQFLKKRYSIIN
jgi:pimeloyl-ACP methyl ester carboxylesterase